MNIVLVGVPGLGKGQLAQDLHMVLKDEHDIVLPVVPADDYMATFDKAVGALADYRVELSLAVRRAFAMNEYEAAIYEASLINNVAYAALRYRRAFEDGSQDDDSIFKWWLTLQTSAAMLLDTFKENAHVFFIEDEPQEEFNKELQEALVAVMQQIDLEYTTVNAFDLIHEELAATLVTDLLKGTDDPGQETGDISEPNGQD